MKITGTSYEVEQFRAKQFRQQVTFQTPLGDLSPFVTTFLSPFRLVNGIVTIALVIFEPENLLAL